MELRGEALEGFLRAFEVHADACFVVEDVARETEFERNSVDGRPKAHALDKSGDAHEARFPFGCGGFTLGAFLGCLAFSIPSSVFSIVLVCCLHADLFLLKSGNKAGRRFFRVGRSFGRPLPPDAVRWWFSRDAALSLF